MENADSRKDLLPDEFASEDEAGHFWDEHSVADYEDALVPADIDVDIEQRHYEIEVDQGTFLALSARARETDRSLGGLACQLLGKALLPK